MMRLFILLVIISLAFVQCDSENNPVSDNGETTKLETQDSISVHSIDLVYKSISNDHLYFTTVRYAYGDNYPYGSFSYALDLEIEFNRGENFDQVHRMLLYSEDGVGWEFDADILQSLTYQDSTLFIPNIVLTNFYRTDMKFELKCFDSEGNNLTTHEFVMENRFPGTADSYHQWKHTNALDIQYTLPANSKSYITNLGVAWVDTLQNVTSHQDFMPEDLTDNNIIHTEVSSDYLHGYYSTINLNAESVQQEIITSVRNVAHDRPPESLLKTNTQVLYENNSYPSSYKRSFMNKNGDLVYMNEVKEILYELDGDDGSIIESHTLYNFDDGNSQHYDGESNFFGYENENSEVELYDLTTKTALFTKDVSWNFEDLFVDDSTLFHLEGNVVTASRYHDGGTSETTFNLSNGSVSRLHYVGSDSILYGYDSNRINAYRLNFETSESTFLDRIDINQSYGSIFDISNNRVVNYGGSIIELSSDGSGSYALNQIKVLGFPVRDTKVLTSENLLLILRISQRYDEKDKLSIYDLNTLQKINEIDLFYRSLSIGVKDNSVKVYEYYIDNNSYNDFNYLAIETFDISELRTYGKAQNKRLKSSSRLKYFLPFTE